MGRTENPRVRGSIPRPGTFKDQGVSQHKVDPFSIDCDKIVTEFSGPHVCQNPCLFISGMLKLDSSRLFGSYGSARALNL